MWGFCEYDSSYYVDVLIALNEITLLFFRKTLTRAGSFL